MPDIRSFMNGSYIPAVLEAFPDRVEFIGLQGSFARGEQNPASDIDTVLILDNVVNRDIERYRGVVSSLPQIPHLCGFFSGRQELLCWDRGELFSFCLDTVPYYNDLYSIVSRPTRDDARLCAHSTACAIYHECCHNALYDHDACFLRRTCKAAVIAIKADHYADTGVYLSTLSELLAVLKGSHAAVLRACSTPSESDFCSLIELLLDFSSNLIRKAS